MRPPRHLPLWIALVMVLALWLLDKLYVRRESDRNPNPAPKTPQDEQAVNWFNPDDTNSRFDPNTKYMTFLPHSGLHNQRISIMNAIVIAKALDRTLILPELNLGNTVWWSPKKMMESIYSDCFSVLGSNPRCDFDVSNYVPVPVERIFDLSMLKTLGVRVVQREDMRNDYLQRVYDAKPSDIYSVSDLYRYHYQFTDVDDCSQPQKLFKERVNLENLKNVNERFITFGSLFSSFRLCLETDELKTVLDLVTKGLKTIEPQVLEAAGDIVDKLGGEFSFTSVHLRSTDGMFKKSIKATIERLVDLLRTETGVTQTSQKVSEDEQTPLTLEECVSLSHTSPRYRIIYLATDMKNPRGSLPTLFDEFPCIFTLSDFPDAVKSLHQTKLNVFNDNRYPSDKGSLLPPLLDAEVAIYGHHFFGTPKSTFSKFISIHNKNRLALQSS